MPLPAQGTSPDPAAEESPETLDYLNLLASILGDRSSGTDFSNFLEPGNKSLQPWEARWLIEVARQYRERFHESPWWSLKKQFSGPRIRQIALGCWLAKDEDLAYRIMLEGFLREPDDKFDPWFAAFAASGGFVERAFTDLKAAEKWMPAQWVEIKKICLLRASGHSREAVVPINQPDGFSETLTEMAMETGAWQRAIDALNNAPDLRGGRDKKLQFIAIYSRDPVLLKRYEPLPDLTVSLMAGDPATHARMGIAETLRNYFNVAELREMAQDAQVSSALEAKLTQGLGKGSDVSFFDMRAYFQEPDLLPDREKSARLAIALAAAQRCDRTGWSNDPPWVATGAHRLLAARALVDLGHADVAFTVALPVLKSFGEVANYPVAEPWVWDDYRSMLLKTYRQYGEIAALTWPEASYEERLCLLGEAMTTSDAAERSGKLLALISAHAESLTSRQALDALYLPLHDLACGAGLPAEVLAAARKVLERCHPSVEERRELENCADSRAHDRRWSDGKRSFRPGDSEFNDWPGKSGSGPDPAKTLLGEHWDPLSRDCIPLKSLAAVKTLLDQKHSEAAAEVLRSLVLRLCLDEKLDDRYTNVVLATSQSSMSFGATPFELVLLCAANWDFPVEWLDRYSRACWQPEVDHAGPGCVRYAALAYAGAGRFEEAASLSRIYLLRTLSLHDWMDAKVVAECVRMEACAAAKRGDRESVLYQFEITIGIDPYRPEIAGQLLELYTGPDRQGLTGEMDRIVDRFWDAKALEVPGSKTYEKARSMWKKH